jgi:hypothetical protein
MIKQNFHKVIEGRSMYPINLYADSVEIWCGTLPAVDEQYWLGAMLFQGKAYFT